ncbi:MAG: anhydro-N-acetylmuramic acid kinase [Bacteroidia bacterium]
MEDAEHKVIGLMSGTSLDGLDIASCVFSQRSGKWEYRIVNAQTIPYDEPMRSWLRSLETSDAAAFAQAHADFGFYLGKQTAAFMKAQSLVPDLIASHGHTIFHQPAKHFTAQIGSGNVIAAQTGIAVAFDFRSLDVALGGQGAPLVPVGDELLFSEYDFCLNLGGFANISYRHNNRRIAFDICPVNIVMNAIAARSGKNYDDEGKMAAGGMLSHYLLNELNQLGFYKMTADAPKSLGKEWVIGNVDPILDNYDLSDDDLLNTLCEHIAFQVGKVLKGKPKGKLLVTGGGAYNAYLLERMRKHIDHEIIIPDTLTIEYKEALIFAFLGLLRMKNEVNCFSSVTGASRDSCCGVLVQPK